jgi:nitrite reductase (NADH) small subunit
MTEQWKLICKVKEIAPLGARVVQRGLAWQELPGVVLFRTAQDEVFALLDGGPHGGPFNRVSLVNGVVSGLNAAAPDLGWQFDLVSGRAVAPHQGSTRTYRVKLDDGKVYLDLTELNAPASRAEAALAGSYAVTTHIAAA